MKKGNVAIQVLVLTVGVFTVIGLFVLALTITTIDAGEVGVIQRWGKVTGRILNPGLHFKIPFVDTREILPTRKVIYETTTGDKQKGSDADFKDYPVDTNTSDGQQVDIFYTIRFSLDPTKAGWVVQNLGSMNALVERIVKTESRVWVRNVPREFTAQELYTGDVVSVQNRIEERLQPVFEENGLFLDSIGIREIKFEPEYVQAIETKEIEKVRVETAKNKAEQAKYEKEARITQAEGQAREQELQRTTISAPLLEKMWIERWNGVLPVYMLGEDTNIMFQP